MVHGLYLRVLPLAKKKNPHRDKQDSQSYSTFFLACPRQDVQQDIGGSVGVKRLAHIINRSSYWLLHAKEKKNN